MTTLLDLIPDPAPKSTAIVPLTTNVEVSYQQLRHLVLQFREKLAVKRGDIVGTSFPNSLEFVVSFLGIGVSRCVSFIPTLEAI